MVMHNSGSRLSKKICWVLILRVVVGLAFIYFYCEYLIYYVTQVQCDWPKLKKPILGEEPVRVMMLADTHFLGSREGHWLDKWRREWQMHRAFQTGVHIQQPEVVFVLGDLFDEGKWCSDEEFDDNVQRFTNYFKVPDTTQMYVIAGNHDVGFHYRITPHLIRRFERKLGSPPVSLVTVRNNHFVLINSMAMQQDGCKLCARAMKDIGNITDMFKCTMGSPLCKSGRTLEKYTRPIILQHFPLYRGSDKVCTGIDVPPYPVKNKIFEERWDCLSKESTEFLIETLIPRAVFGGHTHHSCFIQHSFAPTNDHKIEFPEYTISSFSWRNRLDPKYYLVTVSNEEVVMSKCDLPTENTMKMTAVGLVVMLAMYLWYLAAIGRSSHYKSLPNKEF